MARKYPNTLADAIKAIKEHEHNYCMLHNESAANIQELKKDVELWTERAENNLRARDKAQAAEKETRKQFDDLKERLFNAEIENARLRGYMERVREDDNVADPVVEIEGPEGKRLVSKRHPTPVMNTNGLDSYMYDNMVNREKRKHWTSY